MALFRKNEEHARQGQESTGVQAWGEGCASRGTALPTSLGTCWEGREGTEARSSAVNTLPMTIPLSPLEPVGKSPVSERSQPPTIPAPHLLKEPQHSRYPRFWRAPR